VYLLFYFPFSYIRYILGLLHWLVEDGIFQKVKLCFLPKGHTHNDVDQMFSRLSTGLRLADIFTRLDVERVCTKAYSPTPTFVHLEDMASFSTLIRPLLTKGLKGHSKPRCFVIRRDASGVVRHHYRLQVQTMKKGKVEADGSRVPNLDCWMPHNEKGYAIFNSSFPDINKLFKVSYKPADITGLQATLQSIRPFCTADDAIWWEETIALFLRQDEESCSLCKELRIIGKVNASCIKDSSELQKSKSRLNRKAYKDMFVHMLDASAGHSRFPGPVFPPRGYIWADGRYQQVAEPLRLDADASSFQVRLVNQQQD
jgi:hypothetical protein